MLQYSELNQILINQSINQSIKPLNLPLGIETQNIWEQVNPNKTYNKPQGNLPMFEWGLTKEKKISLLNSYNNVTFNINDMT